MAAPAEFLSCMSSLHVLGILLFAVAGQSALGQTSNTAKRAVQPVNLVVWTDHQKYSLAEGVTIYAALQNNGDKRVYVDRRMFWTGYGGGLKLEIRDEQGNALPARPLSDAIMPPPKRGDTSLLIPLNEGFLYGTSIGLAAKDFFPKPGKYSIRVIYKSWLRKELVAPQLRELAAVWEDTPAIVSEPVRIDVTP